MRTDSGSGGEGGGGSAAGEGRPDTPGSAAEQRFSLDHGEVTGHSKDWRNYHCKTWHLEPTVR